MKEFRKRFLAGMLAFMLTFSLAIPQVGFAYEGSSQSEEVLLDDVENQDSGGNVGGSTEVDLEQSTDTSEESLDNGNTEDVVIPDTPQESTENITEITEPNVYPENQIPYEDIDWSEFGDNGAANEDFRNMMIDKYGIDPLKDQNHGSSIAEKVNEEYKAQEMVKSVQARDSLDYWAPGTVHKGSCRISYSEHNWTTGISKFLLDSFGGDLAGAQMNGYGWCMDYTAAVPPVDHPITDVSAVVKSVDVATGTVYLVVTVTPWDVTDGQTSNENGLIGYQHVGANVQIKKSFTGSMELSKVSSDPSATNGNSNYSLAGAVYNVYNANWQYYGQMTTDASGKATLTNVPAGTYHVLEAKASPGFNLDSCNSNGHTVTVTAGQNATFTCREPYKPGILKLKKASNSTETNGNAYYSLAGAVYGVYSDYGCTQRVGTLTTDASGNTNSIELPAKNYYVKELTPSKGHSLDACAKGTPHTAKLTPGGTATVHCNEPHKRGTVEVIKRSANPDASDGSNCYSYENAKFGVYKDDGSNKRVGQIITDKNGYGKLGNLLFGKYYILEEEAPKGYYKDTTKHKVEITNDTPKVSVTVKDQPKLDPIMIAIKKVDKDTGKPIPVEQGSLEGAEFLFKFYKGDYAEGVDPATQGAKLDKKWTFKTDKDGIIDFSENYLVSGANNDTFYKDVYGKPSLPYGQLVITEIKAPNGYHINGEKFIVKITPPSKPGGISTTVAPVVEEDSVSAKIIKIQEGTNIKIPGTTFEHTRPDGTKKNYVTDENGEIELKGLIQGTHKIVEKSTQDGYEVNKNVFEFKVTSDNKIVAVTNPSDDIGFGFVQESNGDATITVSNKLKPYSVTIKKQNNKGKLLDGAEFTLHGNKEMTDVLDTQVSKGGLLAFKDLKVGKKYYIKETKAPQGYKLPDDPIVFEIYAESEPVNGKFDFYVNGVKYDTSNSNGDIFLTGDKNNRVVNIVVTNNIMLKLPETGSQWMIPLIGLGVILMLLAFFLRKKDKKVNNVVNSEIKDDSSIGGKSESLDEGSPTTYEEEPTKTDKLE